MDAAINNLCQNLKTLCTRNETGKIVETDSGASAEIFYELGKLYASNVHEDAYNYIYSLGLFVASRVRKENLTVSKSIQDLWETLLQQVNAFDTKCDLVNVMKQIELLINDMRQYASVEVSKIAKVNSVDECMESKKIISVLSASNQISDQFINVMKTISDICVKIMFGEGNPTFTFSLCALGSVARGEATPYSDFEHMILLEDDLDENELIKQTERMRWYAILFQFLVVNLGETPVRLLGIPCLNDFYTEDESKDWFYDIFTTCGIRFDSNMPFASIHPLSRNKTKQKSFKTELIQPVSKMVEYLMTDAVLRNGYHLDTVLAKSVFVSGYEPLHKKYRKLVSETLHGQTETVLSSIKTCMDKENVLFEMKNRNNGGNIKKICYRGSSLIIGHLGSLFNVPASNTFMIIDQLVKAKHLNETAGHNLKYIVALSWELRFKFYDKAKQQISEVNRTQDVVAQLVNVIGKNSLFAFCAIWISFWNVLQPVVLSNDLSRSETSKSSNEVLKLSDFNMRSEDSNTVELCTAYLCPEELNMNRNSDTFLAENQDLRSVLLGQVALVHTEHCLQLMQEVFREFDSISGQQFTSTEQVFTKLKHMYNSFAVVNKKVMIGNGVISPTDLSMCLLGQVYDSPCFQRFYGSFYKLTCLVSPYINMQQVPRLMACVYRVGDLCDELQTVPESWKISVQVETCKSAIPDLCDKICQSIDDVKNGLSSFRPKHSLLQLISLSFANRLVRDEKGLFSFSHLRDRFKFLLKEKIESYHNRILNNQRSNDKLITKFSQLTSRHLHKYVVSVFISRVIRGLCFAQAELKYHVALIWFSNGNYQDTMHCCFDSLSYITEDCKTMHWKCFVTITQSIRLLGLCAFKQKKYTLAGDCFTCQLKLTPQSALYLPNSYMDSLRSFTNKHANKTKGN